MKNIAILFATLFLTSGQYCLNQNNKSFVYSDSITSPIINAGNELRIASNHLYASIGSSFLSAGCLIGSLYIPEDAPRDGSAKTVLRALGYGSALASTLFLISGIGYLNKAGISLSEYGVGLKVPINGKK